jgi:hypothetical protein
MRKVLGSILREGGREGGREKEKEGREEVSKLVSYGCYSL